MSVKKSVGYVIDPASSPKENEVFIPATGDTMYVLTRNGNTEAALEVFSTWEEANYIAQSFNNGLDPDINSWGVVVAVKS
jgi:hypothetical protein